MLICAILPANKIYSCNMAIIIHTKEDFEKMRKAGRFAADLLDYITPFVKEGVTTNYLNDLCHEYIVSHGARPAPLGYKGFPKSVCTSVNHVVCHGVPSDYILKDGDILNIDVTPIVDGYHGDSSRMFFVGKPSVKAARLVKVAYEAMMLGIDQVKPGAHFGDIGYAIENYAKKFGYSVVEDFCGHGIGKTFHASPDVLHFGKKSTGPVMKEGMFFTIEPMINAGKKETKISQIDGWTASTRDRSLSAQFEHTVGVTADGVEVFTLSSKNYFYPPYAE